MPAFETPKFEPQSPKETQNSEKNNVDINAETQGRASKAGKEVARQMTRIDKPASEQAAVALKQSLKPEKKADINARVKTLSSLADDIITTAEKMARADKTPDRKFTKAALVSVQAWRQGALDFPGQIKEKLTPELQVKMKEIIRKYDAEALKLEQSLNQRK